jgi:hypothetical protein
MTAIAVSVVRHAIEPAGERTIRIVTFSVFEHSKKHLLHQILAERAIPRHPQQVTKQSNMMALEKQSELGGIARLDKLHQCRISLRFQSSSPSNTEETSKGYNEIERGLENADIARQSRLRRGPVGLW